MEFYGYDEGIEKSYDSYASYRTSESDFHFDYDELVVNFDEFKIAAEDVEERNPMNKDCVTDGGFTSTSL